VRLLSQNQTVGVAIIGCGLIGRKRAAVLAEDPLSKLICVVDRDISRAAQLANDHGCEARNSWDSAFSEEIQAVIVSTANDALASIVIEAANRGKHILCEKPPGRNAAEAERMVTAAKENGVQLKVGFNHRYHPAIQKAHESVKNGAIGTPLYIRAVYGHGGRLGYDADWRCNRELSGGGEMLDQGIHLLDLSRWFLGEFAEVSAVIGTYFWAANAPNRVEDNGFALLRTEKGQVASLHASWTQWKNRFSFEVYGNTGFVAIEGLNGSYGTETLIYGRRREEFGPPITEKHEFPGPDRSWHLEWSEFTDCIRNGREPLGSGRDGLRAMLLVQAIYESARLAQFIRV
jgi:predicted dehydrogenase